MHEGRADIAVEGTVVDGDVNDAVGSGKARGVEDHLAQGRLVVRERGRTAERDDAGEGIVARSRDAGRQCPRGEYVARLPVDCERDPGRLDRRAVGVGDGNVGVGDRYRRPVGGECRDIVPPAAIGVVGVEIEDRRNGGTDDREDRRPLVTPPEAVEYPDCNALRYADGRVRGEPDLLDRGLIGGMRGITEQRRGCRWTDRKAMQKFRMATCRRPTARHRETGSGY